MENIFVELHQTSTLEWWSERAHFVKQNTKSPDISFGIILTCLDKLWCEIIGSTYDCFSLRLGGAENFGHTEVANFHLAILRHKDILRLDVSMQNLSVMQMLDTQANLSEPVENFVLTPVLRLLVLLSRFFDHFSVVALDVSTLSILHHNTKRVCKFIDESFFVANYIWVSQ